MYKITPILIIVSLLISCRHNQIKNNTVPVIKFENNIFNDKTIQTIYSLKDQRNTSLLLPYLKHENPRYRELSALAFGSIQDTASVPFLTDLLIDPAPEIRRAAIFALGQTPAQGVDITLYEHIEAEDDGLALEQLFDAIGKVASQEIINKVASENYLLDDEDAYRKAQASLLVRAAIRKKTSKATTTKAIELLRPGMNEQIRFVASQYFTRLAEADLLAWRNEITESLLSEGFVYTKINMALALKHLKHAETIALISRILADDYDYRIKLSAMSSLSAFEYNKVKQLFIPLLKNISHHVATRASEYFMKNGTDEDIAQFINMGKDPAIYWQVRANLLQTALRISTSKKELTELIISNYENEGQIYRKAYWIRTLQENPGSYEFVKKECFSANPQVIKTYCMEALVAMRSNPIFEVYNKMGLSKAEADLKVEFAEIFKQAIQSEDIALIGMAAQILRDSTMRLRETYGNTYFLKQALEKCKLPQDFEAYVELSQTLAFFNNEKYTPPVLSSGNAINWDLVTSISPDQKVAINTAKGKIVIQLLVNEAPGSVSNFVNLIRQGYFNNFHIHRVVPNFVIQDGCPRGDGWGGPAYTIRSEFGYRQYDEGSVGMASAGKDTESSQWFITHSPTPHLDGRYTIFAIVTEGIENVHEIELGDKILSVSLE